MKICLGTGFEGKKFNIRQFKSILKFSAISGIKFIDTADNYKKGKVQKIIGSNINLKNNKIKILNKFVLINNLTTLNKNLDQSLKNLKVDAIDIYMPHWPTNNYDTDNLIFFVNQKIKEGKIKNFGLSNFSLRQIKDIKKKFKKRLFLQFELNFSNFHYNNKLISFINKNNIKSFCYGIGYNYPIKNEILSKLNKKFNFSEYESSLAWMSQMRNITPIIQSSKLENLERNFNIIKRFKNKKINISNKIQNNIVSIKIDEIIKINSKSGVVYKSLKEAIMNYKNIFPSPLDIADEIKKNGMIKPLFFRRKNKGYELISGQARYWAYRIVKPDTKFIKGILV